MTGPTDHGVQPDPGPGPAGRPEDWVDPIDWDVAVRVASRLAGREPFSGSYHASSLVPDLTECTAQAEELVAAHTGLRPLSGPARARVVDRADWARVNVASFRRLTEPLTRRVGARLHGRLAPAARAAVGTEVGLLLGWMSRRVLGQYDLLVGDDTADQDLVYYVGPNVLALEKRFAFPPREFRLWLALHEVTHRAQFTGVPWLRAHYLSLLRTTLEAADPDPARVLAALRRAVAEVRAGRNPLDEGGLALLLADEHQRAALDEVGGLMSLLEGHGDVTMNRAGGDAVPSAARFARVLQQRRAEVGPLQRLVRQAVGLEAKLRQYEQGEQFLAAVEAAAGDRVTDAVWVGPERLPTLTEIREPRRWLDRMVAAGALPAPSGADVP